ncbi:MAG: CDP-diacylglycerol--serine O-phosphatidyltransferase [bacterium]
MRDKRYLAPNLMTVFNLFLGFLAVISAFKGNFNTGAWLVLVAAICDYLDGKIARATTSFSKFGIEFDSLADVVSFGVAPAMLIYCAQLREHEPIGLVASFLPLAAGAIRLARFNSSLSGFDRHNYTGMPIPTAAGIICSYIIFSHEVWEEMRLPALSIALAVVVSVLMVSTIEFEAMPKFSFRRGRRNSMLFVLVALCAAMIVLYPAGALFPLAVGYTLSQLGRALLHHVRDEDEESVPDVSVSKH